MSGHSAKQWVVVVAASLLTLGCSKSSVPARSTANLNTPEEDAPHDSPPAQTQTFVCYLENCFNTVASSQIDDLTEDFKYPDANEFSQEEMRTQYRSPLFFLDLLNMNLNAKLTSHFKLKEFVSIAKGRYAVFSSTVARKIQEIRNEVRASVQITSGYRSPGYNRRTDGAAKWSRHTYGDAVDFKVSNKSPGDLAVYCNNQNASFYLIYKTHIHCDWRNEVLDPAFYGVTQGPSFLKFEDALAFHIYVAERDSHFVVTDEAEHRVLSISVPHDEEEGELVHNWVITLPDGEVIQSDLAQVRLPKVSGTVHVQATVGGVLNFETVFSW